MTKVIIGSSYGSEIAFVSENKEEEKSLQSLGVGDKIFFKKIVEDLDSLKTLLKTLIISEKSFNVSDNIYCIFTREINN